MKKDVFKPLVLASAITLALTSCSSSDDESDSNTGNNNNGNTTEVTGSAYAPNGSVASFHSATHPLFAWTSRLIFSPAIAAITGLQPVTGATVELIEIDDDGNQVGEVIATTSTSITGSYTLTIPSGVTLSGNLIVRITGNGNTEMRAQVVEQAVDITPVSEFVLQKFIADDTDLDQLTTASVVKLTGEVEEFDLTATADLSSMLAQLETEVGEFVDTSIDTITQVAGDTTALAGSYRLIGLSLGLHDDDMQYNVGTLGTDLYRDDFNVTSSGTGSVNIQLTRSESAWSNFTVFDNTVNLEYYADIETENETIPGTFSSSGILTVEGEFEEDIDGDYAWRFPASTLQFQKAATSDVFFGIFGDAGVRYQTVDTNNDGIKDALDPNQREGDEVFRELNILAKAPSDFSASDMSGTYGAVELAIEQDQSGMQHFKVATFSITFEGTSTFSATQSQYDEFERSFSTFQLTNGTDTESGGDGQLQVSSSGEITAIGGDDADGFFSADGSLMAIYESEFIDDSNPDDGAVNQVEYELMLALKQPASTISIASNTYRVQMLAQRWEGNATASVTTGFSSMLTVDATGSSATANLHIREAAKDSYTADVEASSEILVPQSITIEPNDGPGKRVITLTFEDGSVLKAIGSFNADGSTGIFKVRAGESAEAEPDTLGIMILQELSGG
ncbi:MAG TPA: hypothetical protein DCZ12_07325 [Gammaproteobacteria bacterium]|nr:hypothetical protein [Gammaproteobacteria bacterium]HCO60860.1 hypothetical protein [Porticoccaceae bacterium]